MKRLVFIVFALFVAACGNNGGGGGNGATTVAVTPTNLNCLNGSTICNNSAYGSYTGWVPYSMPYGNTAYNYINYFNQFGFCGCPTGYSPAYNGSMGLGCIASQYLQPIYNWTVFMSFGGGDIYGWGGGGATINIPQVSNVPGSAYQGNCSRQVSQSCLLNQVNNCGAGATCRQVISGSNLGVCINPYQNSNYNNGNYYNYGNPGYGYGYSGYGYVYYY